MVLRSESCGVLSASGRRRVHDFRKRDTRRIKSRETKSLNDGDFFNFGKKSWKMNGGMRGF